MRHLLLGNEKIVSRRKRYAKENCASLSILAGLPERTEMRAAQFFLDRKKDKSHPADSLLS